jgi:membrane-bound inhibitor of C-type lysozyme
MTQRVLGILCVVALVSVTGCHSRSQEALTVDGGEPVVYECENGDRITARYYSLSDGSLNFVKVLLPDSQEFTLPQVLSASGARYTDERMLTWWIKGDSARVEMRDQNGEWQAEYQSCQVFRGTE